MAHQMAGNRLHNLQMLGQSVWIDELQRGLLERRELAALIADDGVSGVTSNPTIFARAFATDVRYRDDIAKLRAAGRDARGIYHELSEADIRMAADQLRRTWQHSGGRDGYVSLEVPPDLATHADETVHQAQEMFRRVDRPNVMIKVPATDAGLLAIRRLIASGVNVNVTLIFGTQRYRQVADAWLRGLEDRVAAGLPVAGIASVASLFASRIDALVDKRLDGMTDPRRAAQARSLRGRTAIAVARLAYREYRKMVAAPRWRTLAAAQAQPQRLLWASTSTKDPSYRDVRYVEELIGPETITTLTLATLAAFRDHGNVAPTLEQDLLAMANLPSELAAFGVDLDKVAAQLEREGLASFAASMDALLAGLAAGSQPQ